MLYSIVDNIIPFIETLNFHDLVKGIAYTIELPIMSENNINTVKRFPVVYNANKTVCSSDDFISLIPDQQYKSIIYFEQISNTLTGQYDNYFEFNASVRIVCWFNLKNINGTITNCETLVHQIASVIPFHIADFGDVYRCTVEFSEIKIRDKSIFSGYTYSEQEKQYLIYPFDFGHIIMNINYRVDRCNTEPILDPQNCQ